MKQSLVEKDDEDDTSELIMTEEEMAWARNTMTPEELAEMLSSGLDLNHFLVMMVIDPPHVFPFGDELFRDAWLRKG